MSLYQDITTNNWPSTYTFGQQTRSVEDYLVLGLPLNGPGGTLNTTDYSGIVGSKRIDTQKSITVNGTTWQTSIQKYYGGAAYLSTSASRVSASSDFEFPGDFTIEFWAYKTAYSSYACPFMIDPDTGTVVSINLGNNINGWWFLAGGFSYNANNTFSASTWTHLAMSRSGTTINCFINGTSVNSGTLSGTVGRTVSPIVGDYRADGQYLFNGYIQDLRIYKGIAKYTSNFTPPNQMLLGA